MKQIKINIISILILFTTLVFVACNHNAALPKENEQNGLAISGKVCFESNALPSKLLSKTSARAAFFNSSTSSIDYDISSFKVVAENTYTKYTINGVITDLGSNEFSYNVLIPSLGEWEIVVTGKSQTGNVDFTGHAFVHIKERTFSGTTQLYLSDNEGVPDVLITPLYKEGQTGSINLKVMNNIDNQDPDPDYKYIVSWTWDTNNKPQGAVNPQNVQISYEKDSFSAPFEFTNVPVGVYKAQLAFTDAEDNLLFTSEQWIHVFSNLVTDTWYGFGPEYVFYDSDSDGDEDITYLAITEAALEYYKENPVETYPTKLLFYADQGSGFDISIVSESKYDTATGVFTDAYDCPNPDPTKYKFPNNSTQVSVVNRNVSFNANDDTVYTVKIIKDNNDHYNEVVCKYANKKVSAYCFPVTDIAKTDYGSESSEAAKNYVTAIYYDKADKKMYGMLQGKYGANAWFPTFWEYDEELNEVHHYSGAIMTTQKITGFIVKDGYLYVADYDKGGIRMRCFELVFTPGDPEVYPPTEDEYSLAEVYSKQILDIDSMYTEYDRAHSVLVSDMICAGDEFYILINDPYCEMGFLYSRGAVVKFNPQTRICSALNGLAITDHFEHEVDPIKYQCSKSPDSFEQLNSDRDGLSQYFIPSIYVRCYIPSSYGSTDEFLGPQKILSYNNNYLYIADSGKIFMLDADNIISYMPINRIVKYDIQTMKIQELMFIDTQYPFIHPEMLILPGTNSDSTNVYCDGEAYTGIKYPCIEPSY